MLLNVCNKYTLTYQNKTTTKKKICYNNVYNFVPHHATKIHLLCWVGPDYRTFLPILLKVFLKFQLWGIHKVIFIHKFIPVFYSIKLISASNLPIKVKDLPENGVQIGILS